MTEAEVSQLLAFCAGYDPSLDTSAVAVWQDSLVTAWVPNLSLDEAIGAAAEHYRCTPVRVKPADILRRVRDDRAGDTPRLGIPRCGVPPTAEYRQARAELERIRDAARAAGW